MSELTRGTVLNDNYVWDVDLLMWVKMTQPGTSNVSSSGQLADGVDDTIKATVKDYANANPLTVVLVDTSGDAYVAGGSSGLTDTELRATPVPVSVSGGATSAKQDTGNTSLASIDGKLTNPLPVSGPLTDAALRASDVKITLDGESVPVTGTFFQVTQPISNANLDAALSTLATSAKQPALVGGRVPVDGSGVTQPVSGTFWQATQPISHANLDVALSTRLSPADTLTGVTTVTTITNPVSSKVALTGSAPTSASVGVANAQAVASNANRKGLVLTNVSVNRISLGLAQTAVLDDGITLYPGGVWCMDEYTFMTGAVNAIASAAASDLAIQELT